jgi:hypothetical protein
MTFLLFILWVALNTILFNIGIQVGWNFDPGFVGPAIIVFVTNITAALYASKSN